MRYSDVVKPVVALAAALVFSAPAEACFVCDEVVELDRVRASCFLADYENYAESIRLSEMGRAEIDLSGCAQSVASGTRGIAAMPLFPGGSSDKADTTLQADLRSVYILDAEGAACLKKLLESRKEPIDPSIRVDLVSACQ